MSELFSRSEGRRPRRGFRRSGDPEPKQGSLIGWAIFLLLLVGLVALCWTGSLYIFGHPEEPFSYAVLKKFKKIEPPQRFIGTAAPKGEFLDPDKLLARYGPMTPRELKKESAALLREYIRNYEGFHGLVPYVIGQYNILDSYQLTENDFFQSGVVAIAQAVNNPQVLLEHVFTADEKSIPTLHRTLLTGLDIPLKRTYDLSAIINVEKLDDGRLKVTAVPIHYPSYSSTQGPGGFSLEPPKDLNVEAGLPILSKAKLEEADQRYASYRRKVGLAPADGGTPAPVNELMRVQPATTADGATPEPAPQVARAEPADGSTPPVPAATPEPPAAAPTPEPPVARAIPVDGTAAPTPPQVAGAQAVGADVPLKPFMGGSAQPQQQVTSTSSGNWATYQPGQMPRGRLVDPSGAASLTDTPAGDPVYLQGDFVVTASGPTRAVLRSPGSPNAQNMRVIVEFPRSGSTPSEGSNVSRRGDRPFLITKIERKDDGTVNVWAREVTSE